MRGSVKRVAYHRLAAKELVESALFYDQLPANPSSRLAQLSFTPEKLVPVI